ncbi:Chromatin modification-related protein eaf3 [Cladobotryum mycophilum]|uniref:Chromatin modification-related protein EAF3 n=1 Tax=Cladobotryum mycophilum TaxID=491253 RepID=A0ABR0SZQ1_9HYPO
MAPARQQPTPTFAKDEKVLCFHMDMLYEAKIMDVQPAEKPAEGYRYKVHYKGWKNTWDDWVMVDRIRPFDDEHKELAAQLHSQLKTSMQKTTKLPKKNVKSGGESGRVSEERGSATIQPGRGGRRGKDWELEQSALDESSLVFPLPATKFALPSRVSRSSDPSSYIAEHSIWLRKSGSAFMTSRPLHRNHTCFITPPDMAIQNPTWHVFPVSNERRCLDTPLPYFPEKVRRKKAVRIALLRQAPDHLLKKPKAGHRYLSAAGRPLYDNRYIFPASEQRYSSSPRTSPKVAVSSTTRVKAVQVDDATQSRQMRSTTDSAASRCNEEDAFHNKPMINISVPDHIQAMLVDDWENITKNNQLVPLPHPKPVTKIFEDYLVFERPRREEGSSSMDILEEVVAGFREYFEKALSRILLYRFERHQYIDIRKLWDNAEENSQYKNVCDVYGAEHLARLIGLLTLTHYLISVFASANFVSTVSMPELLAQTNMDQQSVSRLREEIGKFTTWLGRHCESYFVSEYETPSQEYIEKARSF